MQKIVFKKKFFSYLVVLLLIAWFALHIPGILYGTKQLPLHQSYVGDEQSPVNGALHVLQEKSLLGLRNVRTLYYGPVFSMVVLPAVVADAGVKFFSSAIHTAEDYKNYILYDWGGIVIWGRIIAILFSLLGLFAAYKFLEGDKNKYGWSSVALVGTGLLAANYYFFEYSHFIKHWIFIVTALLVELWTLRRIVEGGGTKWWVFHAGAALFSAGISFISLGYLVMWGPVLVKWYREKNFTQLKKFLRLTYAIIIGSLLLIFWHPSVIARYLGYVGVGEPTGGLGSTQNPFAFGDTSLGYYGTLIGLNHLPLLMALAVLAVALWKKRIWEKWQIWVLIFPALFNLILFVPAEHYEGRYMLPTIACLVVLVGYLLKEYYAMERLRTTTVLITVLLSFYVIFHAVHVGKWMEVYAEGPAEKAMLETVLQKTSEGKEKVLLVQNYIAGHPHTKEAYLTYAQSRDKLRFNLYKELLTAPDPKNVTLLNATYMWLQDYVENPVVVENYDQVVVKYEPRVELNQFDYIDENITRIWWYDELMPRFVFVK